MTGIEVAAVALVLGARSAIRRKRDGVGPAEIIARAYIAEQRIAGIKTQAIRDLNDLERRRR